MSNVTQQRDLSALTVAELKARLQNDFGIAPGDVEPIEAAGHEPIKADLVRALQEADAESDPGDTEADTKIFRYASFLNPRTGREVTKRVTKDGGLAKRNVEATGLSKVDEYVQVRARNRPDALARIEAGEGTRFRRTDDGTVEEVGS